VSHPTVRTQTGGEKIWYRILTAKADELIYMTKRPHNLYSSSDVISRIKSGTMRRAGQLAFMGEITNVHTILIRKPAEKISLGKN
jgi:hypothetical protein